MSNTKKGKRKLSNRMKKAIRTTLGGIFLTTAVVVALIPQKETEAAGGTPQVTVSASDSSIPIIDDQDTIYTTGDGMFQFAYVEKGSGGDKVAVIVGYDYERSLDQGVLTIPNTVDAYVKYTHAQGTAGGYVAVGKSGNVLYYPVYRTEIQKQPTGEVDEEDNPIMEDVEVQVLDRYDPCLYSTFEQWYYNADGTVRDPKDFYYDSKPSSTANTLDEYLPTTDEIYQRIQQATVAYISSQHVVKEGDTWVLDDTPNVGIFSKATNITTLKTGGDLLGIGDYAFYECASLQGIELGDGANTIGNYAFANCVNLKYANFPTNSSIKSLGDHAFYNCRSLEKFTMPVAVTKIGDSAFEGCAGMTEIDLNANGQQVLLQQVGPDVFKNCTSLECLIFPEYFSQDFDIAWIEGDTSLKYIKIPNPNMQMVAKEDVTFEKLMSQLPAEFYFEGPADSKIHDISKTNSYAFKYLDEEIYEKVVNATGDAGSGQSVFRVNNFNELIYFYMDDTVKQIDIPGIIGPYKITVIGSDSFQANHRLTKITIPSTITEIQDNAFKGCHALKDVIFEEPISLTTIGDGAFDTQVIDPILDTCTLDAKPVLTFTAPAEEGSAPFDYAMNSANNINTGSQELTYITFYTGWPSNLTIQYNPDKGTNELVDYPKLNDLSSYSASNYPYITPENAQAAATAYAAYKRGDSLSQDQIDVLNSALNIVLPTGVETIKEGIFSGLDAEGKDVAGESANVEINSITTNGLETIDPYTFAGCSNLIGAYINGETSKLGDYAFKDCEKLEDVDILSPLEEYGIRPFKGCSALTHVEFGNNPNYTCDQAVVYGTANGSKTSLLEVLEPRGLSYGTGTLTKQELAGITAVAEEAAMNCDGILSADFSESKITELPESVFAETDELYSVILPDSIRKIAKHAFRKSNIRYLEIPKTLSVIDNSAFEDDPQTITFYCEADSPAADYASNFSNIVVSDKPVTFKVTFYDDDAVTILDTVEVPAGGNAETHIVPTKAGYVFKAWMPNPVGVMEDMKTYATYVPEGEVTYTVQFVDHDDKVLSTQVVPQGGTAVTPVSPERTGYKFTGWRPAFSNVQDDLTIYAQYEKITNDTGSGNGGDGNGSGNGGTGGNGNGTGNGTNNATLYTLTVVGGSGSGSYASGANAILLADNPPSGKVFDKWVTETQGVTIASASTAATTLTMPASNLTVTATYKDAPSSGNSNNNSGSNNNGGSTTVITKPNTSVTIDKDGIPNKDSASASVSGSTDNFILKITESAYAKEQVKEALEEEYGDLDDIRYFPMDISLYDSTGTKKVENTDSLRVTVTLPIPEDLVKYAGNNKVGYVVNGKLVKISPKFTTINGVPCITFVAPHFSPYVIYADTSDLSAGTVLDSTPKTGDGIAPKWFLSMGLAAVAVFLFVKKDKKRVAK